MNITELIIRSALLSLIPFLIMARLEISRQKTLVILARAQRDTYLKCIGGMLEAVLPACHPASREWAANQLAKIRSEEALSANPQ